MRKEGKGQGHPSNLGKLFQELLVLLPVPVGVVAVAASLSGKVFAK